MGYEVRYRWKKDKCWLPDYLSQFPAKVNKRPWRKCPADTVLITQVQYGIDRRPVITFEVRQQGFNRTYPVAPFEVMDFNEFDKFLEDKPIPFGEEV